MGLKIRRGDIVLVNLEPVIGSEQGKIRPALILQNDMGNEYSNTTIVAPITSKTYEKEYPFIVQIELEKTSTILLNQIRTIDKSRIVKLLTRIDDYIQKKVDKALKTSLGLD